MHILKRAFFRGRAEIRERLCRLEIVGNPNEQKIAALRNAHRGRRGLIVASGPSLLVSDIEKAAASGLVTFACNKIYLIYGETYWRPTYYSISDVKVAENNRDRILQLDEKKLFTKSVFPWFKDETEIVWFMERLHNSNPNISDFRFSHNAFQGVFGGWTVVYFQMQLAYYMGIRELYITGLDFSFKVPAGTGQHCPHGEILESKGEINHFHPDYRKPGETWTMPRTDLQEKAFIAAKLSFENAGGKIVNVSRDTKLEVFPRANLEDIL